MSEIAKEIVHAVLDNLAGRRGVLDLDIDDEIMEEMMADLEGTVDRILAGATK